MAKANKDGWVRHRGGKCPVEAGTLIDVKYRDGEVNIAVPALTGQRGSTPRTASNWSQEHRDRADIMAFRLHRAEEKTVPIFETGAGPLEWRDRIRQIDAEEAERNAEHRQAIEALEEERLSLVQKLEAEGFKLIEVKPACDGMPAEDMSDWHNWKVGDFIELIDNERAIPAGSFCQVLERMSDDYEGNMPVLVGCLINNEWPLISNMKWHSRP